MNYISSVVNGFEKDENEFNKFNKLNKMMSEEEKLKYYQSENFGSPFVSFIGFRCTKNLSVYLNTKAMIEGRDISQIIRRLLTKACEEEGFDRNA